MLETSRLYLKWATLNDAPLLLEMNQDPEVMRFTGDVSQRNLDEIKTLFTERFEPQRTKYKMGRFIVTLKDGTFLGWCGLQHFPESNEVDLGYRFMKKHWGKGYATEACQASLRYGFEELKLKKIIAKAHPNNLASIKILQHLGMTFRGLVNDSTYPGMWVLYDISEKEFKS